MERYLRSLVVWFTCSLSLSLLPLVGVCCSLKPCSVVLQIIALGGFSGFGFHEVVQVVFPSLGRSSRSPFVVSRFVESWVPLGCFPGPSFLALCCVSQGVSPPQFLPFFPFLYETKKSPPTRRPKKKKERSAPRWRLSREQIRSQGPSQQSCQGAQLRRVHVSVSACFHQLLSCFFLRIQSSLQDYRHGLLCFLHRRRMKICCLGRIHYVC